MPVVGFDPRHRNYAYQNEPVLAVDADERGQYEIGVRPNLFGTARRHLRGEQVTDDEVARRADADDHQTSQGPGRWPGRRTHNRGPGRRQRRGAVRRVHPRARHRPRPESSNCRASWPPWPRPWPRSPGSSRVWGADREVLHVTAPTWTTDQLHAWALAHIGKRLYAEQRDAPRMPEAVAPAGPVVPRPGVSARPSTAGLDVPVAPVGQSHLGGRWRAATAPESTHWRSIRAWASADPASSVTLGIELRHGASGRRGDVRRSGVALSCS